MTIAEDIKQGMADAWFPAIYSEKIRSLRTRSYSIDVPVKENAVEIMYTLLGIELKVGRRRFSCPDLATARYIRVFARIGCREFAIPYDITRISSIADELETSWQRCLLLVHAKSAARGRGQLVKAIRSEITELGPGDKMPEFKQSTKQRST